MAKLSLKQGTTSKLLRFYAENADGTGPFIGMTFATSGLKAYYAIEGGASTAITLVTGGAIGTWTSATLNPIDATNMPGNYELGLPNTVLASGKSVILVLSGAANLAQVQIEIELTAIDNQDASLLGLTGVATVATQTSQTTSLTSISAKTTLIATNAGDSPNTITEQANIAAIVPNSGAVIAGSAGVAINTGLTAANINSYKGQVVVFTSGVLLGQTHMVASSTTGANSILTILTTPASSPAAGDTFRLVTGIGQKAVDFLVNAMGADSKVLLSTSAQTGVTIPTIFDTMLLGSSINTAVTTATTTVFSGQSGLSGTANAYTNAILVFTSGANAGLSHRIASYVPTNNVFTMQNPFPVAPASTDTFKIVSRIE